MNRTDRLSAILVQMQSRSLVKAQQIAYRFEISLRTVYRDIRALEEAGIPIAGNPGIGYSLVEGYKLPPLMFTQAEALAFLTAEKLINKLTDPGNSEHYRSGVFFSKTNWYLITYCQSKQEYRTFKISRIQTLETADAIFSTRHPPLKDFLHEVRKTEGLEEVIISIPTDKQSILNGDKYYYGFISRKRNR